MAILPDVFDAMAHAAMSNFDLALDLASQGVSVFPCRPENGPTDEHGEPEWKEKTPYPGVLWRSASTTNENRIRQWWSSYPDAIPAIDLSKSGLVVIDLDRKPGQADGVLAFNDLATAHNDDLASVPKVDTVTGGTHLYYRQWAKHGNGRGALPLGVDVRGSGGYVIAPGATMLDGRRYEPEEGYFLEADLPPQWLIDVLSGSRERPAAQFTVEAGPPVSDERKRQYGHTALDAEMRSLAAAQPGTRNEEANRIAFRIGQLVGGNCLTFSEAYAALANAAMSWGIPANDKALGTKGTIARAIRDGTSSPRMPPPDPDVITLAPKPKYMAMEDGTLTDSETGEIIQDPNLIDPNPFYWSDPSKLPMREWVYGGHYIRKFLSLTLAPGGVGKSSLTMVEALAMATGEPLLGIQPHGYFNVWLWNGEDPADEMQRRMTAAVLHFGLSPKGLERCLFMNSGRNTEIVIAKEEKTGTKIAHPIVEQVKAAIRRRKIDVLIIDPFVSSHMVSENDNGAINAVAKEWAKIADETNCSIELVHHVRKTMGGEITVEDGRGASALLAAARSARVLNPMSDDQAAKAGLESRRGYFKMDNGKSNMAPPPDQSFWFQLVSVPLMNGPLGTNGDNVAVVAPWRFKESERHGAEVDIRAVQEAIAENVNCRADSRSPEWAGDVIAQVMDIDVSDPGNRKIVAGLIEAWVKQGHLKEVIRPDERRRPKPFIEVGKLVEKCNQ